MKTDEKTAERQQVMEMGTMKAIRRREYDAYQTLMCYERKDYEWRENKTEDGVEFTVRIRRFIGLNVNYFLFFLKKLNKQHTVFCSIFYNNNLQLFQHPSQISLDELTVWIDL